MMALLMPHTARWSYIARVMGRVIVFAILLAGAALALFPLIWMLSTSLKPDSEVFKLPPSWIPAHPRLKNYREALTLIPYWRYTLNTVIITTLVVSGTVITSTMVAYSFARLRAPGLSALFALALSTIMLPTSVTLIPTFLLYRQLHWIGTYLPLVVPSWLGGGAFNIFLLRQFFLALPREPEEAARVDGAGYFTILWKIVVPQSLPALTAVAIFNFVASWNDFLDPLIYLDKPEQFTLSLGINSFKDIYFSHWNYLMAAAFVAALPCVLVVFFANRLFIRGVVISGHGQ
jgi:multiple sugar transport system permease protein